MSKPEKEIVVRFCHYTNKLVLAEMIHDYHTELVCMHGDSIEEDEDAVINWLKEHGLNI